RPGSTTRTITVRRAASHRRTNHRTKNPLLEIHVTEWRAAERQRSSSPIDAVFELRGVEARESEPERTYVSRLELAYVVSRTKPWRALRAIDAALEDIRRGPMTLRHHEPGCLPGVVVGEPHRKDVPRSLEDGDAPSALARAAPPEIGNAVQRFRRVAREIEAT